MYRIFIVEDDPIIARTVRQGLLQWGIRCALRGGFQPRDPGVCRL